MILFLVQFIIDYLKKDKYSFNFMKSINFMKVLRNNLLK